MDKKPRRILLVDDDVELVTLLVDYLTLEGFEAEGANDGPDGLHRLALGDFDLVVLDVMMPGMNGIDVLREIRSRNTVPVLMLTAKGDPIERIIGLELGADDYVAKPCPPRELVARINAILRRASRWGTPGMPLSAGPLTISSTSRTVTANDRPIDLTTTEFSLLELLARQIGKPVPKEDIYPRVLGRTMGPYDRAIDVHVSSVRHKLAAVVGKAVTIDSIRGIGYQLVVHPDVPA